MLLRYLYKETCFLWPVLYALNSSICFSSYSDIFASYAIITSQCTRDCINVNAFVDVNDFCGIGKYDYFGIFGCNWFGKFINYWISWSDIDNWCGYVCTCRSEFGGSCGC